jgi:hypothetical protein
MRSSAYLDPIFFEGIILNFFKIAKNFRTRKYLPQSRRLVHYDQNLISGNYQF